MQSVFHQLFRIVDFKKEYQQKSSGLSYVQLHALELIFERGPIKTLEISKTMNISPSTMIGVLDELEKQKLITRQRQLEDKRVVLVAATKKGNRIVENHFREDRNFVENLLRKLDDDEKSQLLYLIDKMTGDITEPEALFK